MTLPRGRKLRFAALALLVLAGSLSAQAPEDERQRSQQTLQRLITAQNFRDFGFDSFADVKNVSLDTPFRRYFVPSGAIASFKDTDNPISLLHDGGEWLYPVRAGGSVRCFITIANRGGTWRTEEIGNAAIARALSDARTKQVASTHLPAQAFFAVEVVDTPTYVLGWRTDGSMPGDPGDAALSLQVIAIQSQRSADPVGAQPAQSVFRALRDQSRGGRAGAPGGR
jgi:hypothetical protein